MCGRIRNPRDLTQIAEAYGLKQNLNFPYNPNLAPTEETLILGLDKEGNKKLRLARFGLIPAWAKDAKVSHSMINARAETIAEKPAFKSAFEKRPCIVPVEGFYEWRKEGETKQPYYFSRVDGELMSLACIWEFNNKLGEDIYSFAIITSEANKILQPYHDRMPVMLESEHIEAWMTTGRDRKSLLRPSSAGLAIEKMDPSMNNSRNKEVMNSL